MNFMIKLLMLFYTVKISYYLDRILKGVKGINENDVIVYYGFEDDKLLQELSLRYLNKTKIYLYQHNGELKEISKERINNVFYKRFNLVQKAKESDVLGLIVGSLSLDGLNDILEDLKRTLKSCNKKFYTFLLGKITLEKLSNFVEYIDCFVLIACPFSAFYDFKTLMKPLVSPMDIKLAFDPNFKWDLSYSFDIKAILEKDSANEKGYNIETETDISKELSQITDLQVK
jgi:diphthamide biosynthesis enzyme Dph1/Dph2-like protein